jgi:putative restriction endonuclease
VTGWYASTPFGTSTSSATGSVIPCHPSKTASSSTAGAITLIGARGIWKPAGLDVPLSITTSWRDPYGDEADDRGFLQYRYFGDPPNPAHPDNAGLRRCLHEGRPIMYFRAVDKGWYSALWPMVLVHDDVGTHTFTGAVEDVTALRPGITPDVADDARRAYATRLAMVRLHQAKFRQRVLTAYRKRCSVCSIRHEGLLDAAHILADRDERGEPVVRNGLALCKIHHAAFDTNILGIRPDLVVRIRADVLDEHDGPMLRHGLQELHGVRLVVLPHRELDHPDPERLEVRYEEFRDAG